MPQGRANKEPTKAELDMNGNNPTALAPGESIVNREGAGWFFRREVTVGSGRDKVTKIDESRIDSPGDVDFEIRGGTLWYKKLYAEQEAKKGK